MTAEWIPISAVGHFMIVAKSACLGRGDTGGCQAVMVLGSSQPAVLKPKNLIGVGWVFPVR